MLAQIYVTCDGDWDEPEVRISGSAKSLADFGELLSRVEDTTTLKVPFLENEFYPVSVNTLVVELKQSSDDRLTVTIDKSNINFIGTNAAIDKLGNSLMNFFDDESSVGDHFHLDYYEGNHVLNRTNCHLIFLCDR